MSEVVLLIVTGWSKWAKRSRGVIVDVAWYVNSSNFTSEFLKLTGSRKCECGRIWPGSSLANLSIWSRKRTREQASFEAVTSEGKEVLTLPFPAPCCHVSFRLPLACDFSRYLLNGELTCRLEMLRFSTLWEVTSSS